MPTGDSNMPDLCRRAREVARTLRERLRVGDISEEAHIAGRAEEVMEGTAAVRASQVRGDEQDDSDASSDEATDKKVSASGRKTKLVVKRVPPSVKKNKFHDSIVQLQKEQMAARAEE